MHFSYDLKDQDTLDAINELLPQIEDEIKAKLQVELSQQFQTQYEEDLKLIQQQAHQQYQVALQQLQLQAQKLAQEKLEALKSQLISLQEKNIQKQQHNLLKIQQKFIMDNFSTRIMNHPSLKSIQQDLQSSILAENQAKHQISKQRKIKEILIKYEQREQKIRKERDKAIKNQQYIKVGLESLKNDIQLLRVGIASMKSEYNIKIRKIQQEIKKDKQKCRSLENKNESIPELRFKLETLENIKSNKLKQQNQIKNIEESSQQENCQYELPNHNVQHADSNNISQQFQEHSLMNSSFHQPLHQKFSSKYLSNSHEIEESDNEEWKSDMDTLHPPGINIQYVRKQAYTSVVSKPSGPILNSIDISSLLRERWQQDPLQKYIAKQNEKNASNKIKQRSKFHEQYHAHLKTMNCKKGKKLSEEAKKAIIKNLSEKYCLYR